MRSPLHIRLVGRITTIVLLIVVATMVTWFVTGMPKSVETAMSDALWAPCPLRYAAARSAFDTADADAFVLKPRSRFESAITCATLRAKRTKSVVK